MGNIQGGQGGLRPLNELLGAQPQQQYQPQQPVQPQYQPQPQQQVQPPQQPAAPGGMTVTQVTSSSQLQGVGLQNNGRVELMVQDRNNGYLVFSGDAINISSMDQMTGGIGVGQELALFDANKDGWIQEHELKGAPAASTNTAGKTSAFETIASTTIGGGIAGLAAGKITGKVAGWAATKFSSAFAGKVAALPMGYIGTGVGMALGVIGGVMMDSKNSTKLADSQTMPVNGYRPETQWNNDHFIKAIY